MPDDPARGNDARFAGQTGRAQAGELLQGCAYPLHGFGHAACFHAMESIPISMIAWLAR